MHSLLTFIAQIWLDTMFLAWIITLLFTPAFFGEEKVERYYNFKEWITGTIIVGGLTWLAIYYLIK